MTVAVVLLTLFYGLITGWLLSLWLATCAQDAAVNFVAGAGGSILATCYYIYMIPANLWISLPHLLVSLAGAVAFISIAWVHRTTKEVAKVTEGAFNGRNF